MSREPLDVMSMREELGLPWRYLEAVTETGSTNADLVARAAAGEDIDGIVLIAEHQTAGRGRMDRTWSAAPRAQITMSAGIEARDIPPTRWGWLPLAAGVAVIDTVAEVTGITAALKWPNDVLVGDRKLAGILSEVAARTIVVGIGLNITLRPDEVGERGATSLLDLGVEEPDRTLVATRLLNGLGHRVTQWRNEDPQLRADYRANSLTIGTPVRAMLPGGRELAGTARAVDDQGRLQIETKDGQTVGVSAGDIVHLRPNP